MHKYKVCYKCNIKKELKDCFSVDKSQYDGFDAACKLCKSIIQKGRRRKSGKFYLNPKQGFNPDDSNYYIIFNCEICDLKFFPLRSSHKRCNSCTYICRNIIHHSLTAGLKIKNKWIGQKVSRETLIAVSKKFVNSNLCCYCNRSFTENNPKSLDHIIPVCNGGTNDAENINISCLECNYCKKDLPLSNWVNLCGLIYKNLGELNED